MGKKDQRAESHGLRIDPDIFGMINATGAILNGLEMATRFYGFVTGSTPARTQAKVEGILHALQDLLAYIQEDIRIIREVAQSAELSGDRSFRPGRYAFVTREQFRRYERTALALMGRLKEMVKLTNRLDRIVAPWVVHISPTASGMSKLQGDLDRLLRDRRQTIDEAADRLASVARDLDQIVARLRGAETGE